MRPEDFAQKSLEERGELIAHELELIDLQDALGDLDQLAVNLADEEEEAAAEAEDFDNEEDGDELDEE
ncbi:MAG: hypothetical protein WC350_06245 [Candidatus Micrarchaeia archaeon]